MIITKVQAVVFFFRKDWNTVWLVLTGVFTRWMIHGCLVLFLNTVINLFLDVLYFLAFKNGKDKTTKPSEGKAQIK